jgi:hypothetical protein
MTKVYHNRSSIYWGRILCDDMRRYKGDGRHRRRRQYVKAAKWFRGLVIKC